MKIKAFYKNSLFSEEILPSAENQQKIWNLAPVLRESTSKNSRARYTNLEEAQCAIR